MRNKFWTWFLSGLGLIPFVYFFVHPQLRIFFDYPSEHLKFYGALIVSFLGGIYWGIALLKEDEYNYWLLIYGAFLTTLVWLLLVWDSPLEQLILIFLLAYLVDFLYFTHQASLKWFLILRTVMTLIVVTLLALIAYNQGVF